VNLCIVTSDKGGVGKTAVAVCLAHELEARGLSVGLYDADPRAATASRWATTKVAAFGRSFEHFDWVIADTQAGSQLTDPKDARMIKRLQSAADSTVVLVPTGVGLAELAPAVGVAERLGGLIVLTRVPYPYDAHRERVTRSVEDAIEPDSPVRVIGSIRQSAAFRHAFDKGVGLRELGAKHNAYGAIMDVEDLADEVLHGS